jgi:hypothetical protein
MMHTRLLGVLRTICPTLPTDATPAQAWAAIRPFTGHYLKHSFWSVLSSLQFAKTDARQMKIAEYIWRQKERAKKAGKDFPPKPIHVKQAILPQPHII